ncbi:GGDEF domain-containing protein [Escherichia coli]|nr:GGDEF domain-containing protein [Escherichia coli]HAY5253438.1 GGDEF domain-containing protein [Shigella flexneri]EJS0368274.1 GGDEF domain-containing protein [Escherichia coli]TJP34913.1 GGDEF domain-containing protein [Escherichia coli]HAY7194720.1 GGDEF domain-containing protein [Shigella flexneri]HAY7198970.1 GGDEF domain-containing protein [Shigella flexneri]
MEKDYLRISSTVLVSLLFGLALVLVNSWFNQPGVEEVVPRSTYLMVMIALFFIDTVAFIFMQLYFIYDRRQFSNCILSLAFLSCLIYFVKTVIIIQQIIEGRLTSSVVQNDIAIYYLFRQMSLCILIFLALVNKVSENTKQRNLFSKKMTLCISLFFVFCFLFFVFCFLFFVFGGPIVAHILSSHYESYNLHIAELTNENGQVVWKASYVTIMIFMWLTLLSVNLYFNGLRYDIWNGVTVIAFCAVLYNISLLFMSRYSVSTWYISRTIEVVSKLTVMVIFMCHIFSALRVTKNIAHRDPLTNIFNRNYFFNELTVQSASAKKTPYCVMIMDIDHFKKVNDTWGHPVGDQVIKTVVNIIGKSIRPDDLLARVGGEEFGVLLTDIDTERAKALAERIRENVERLTGDNPEYAIPQKVTISIGAVVTQENALNPNEIYRLADNALYEAKETGRNKVVVRDVVNFCESP